MSELVNVLSKDMGVSPYLGESSQNYKCRLIYSAICEWMRYATQDKYGDENSSKSKHYLLSRCTEILNGFLEYEPECRIWFEDEDSDEKTVANAIRSIREKMIRSGELVEVTEKKHLTVPRYNEINCALGYSRLYGFSEQPEQVSMVGITRIKQSNKNDSFEQLNHYDLEKYLHWIFERGEWVVCDDIERFEFFDITSKRIPSQSWIDKPIKSFERHIARITLYNGYHEYWVLKYLDGKWYCRALETVMQEYKEERRILLGLKKIYGNTMKAEMEYKAPVILLRLFCRLPVKEEIILDTFAWPLTGYNDKVCYVVPYKLWDSIKEYLTDDLGIEIKEKR